MLIITLPKHCLCSMPRENHGTPGIYFCLNNDTADNLHWHLSHCITGGCMILFHQTLFRIQVLINTLSHVSSNGKTLCAVISYSSIQLHSWFHCLWPWRFKITQISNKWFSFRQFAKYVHKGIPWKKKNKTYGRWRNSFSRQYWLRFRK